jgi:hypothetical protein
MKSLSGFWNEPLHISRMILHRSIMSIYGFRMSNDGALKVLSSEIYGIVSNDPY